MNKKAIELMKAARKTKGLKQSDIAKKMGLKSATISSWEVGNSEPDIDSFVQYCNLCGVDFAEILKMAYGDPQEELEAIECTAKEIEMIKKYRALDARGQNAVEDTLDREFSYTRHFVEESLIRVGQL